MLKGLQFLHTSLYTVLSVYDSKKENVVDGGILWVSLLWMSRTHRISLLYCHASKPCL